MFHWETSNERSDRSLERRLFVEIFIKWQNKKTLSFLRGSVTLEGFFTEAKNEGGYEIVSKPNIIPKHLSDRENRSSFSKTTTLEPRHLNLAKMEGFYGSFVTEGVILENAPGEKLLPGKFVEKDQISTVQLS